jgi:AcrR family transcriptional regulator
MDLLRTEDLDELRVADIAASAGVTERTVYRHFATRDGLLRALWEHIQRHAGSPGFPARAEELVTLAPQLFVIFDQKAEAMRSAVFSKAGRELRLAMNKDRKAAFLKAVQDARPDLKGDALIRRCAVVQLLNSAFAWAVMKDFWGLDGAEAGRAASEAVEILLGANAGPQAKTKPEKEKPSC